MNLVAQVDVELVSITGLGTPALLLAAGDTPYIAASIHGRFLGRSADLVPDTLRGTGRYDFPGGRIWRHRVMVVDEVAFPLRDPFDDHGARAALRTIVNRGGQIEIRVVLRSDRNDDAQQDLSVVTHRFDPLHAMFVDNTPTVVQFNNAGVQVQCTVSVRRVPPRPAAVAAARAADERGPVAAVVEPQVAVVRITRVAGLHRPYERPSLQRLSLEVPGYTSQDDLGRIFLSRAHDGAWANNFQAIDLTAEITLRVPVPAPPQLTWTLLQIDDPSDDVDGIHRTSGPIFDPRDHAGGRHNGSFAGDVDNEGTYPTPKWVELATPVGTLDNRTAWTATMTVAAGGDALHYRASIRLLCPNTGGDRFVVEAELVAQPGWTQFSDRTGIMSMWKRIEVQYVSVPGALALPVDLVPQYFEPAFIQLEIRDNEVAPAAAGWNPQYAAAASTDDINAASLAYIDRLFTRRTTAGTFALIAGREPYPLPPGQARILLASYGRLGVYNNGGHHIQYLDLLNFPEAGSPDYVQLHWLDGARVSSVGFIVVAKSAPFMVSDWTDYTVTARDPAPPALTSPVASPPRQVIRYFLAGHDATPNFPAAHADGRVPRTEYPMTYFYPTFAADGTGAVIAANPGYGAPARPVWFTAFSPGGAYVSGISPMIVRGAGLHFSGRLMIFTHHNSFANRDATPVTMRTDRDVASDLTVTIVHEFTHSFGFPHKCGRFFFKTPRTGVARNTCCMNYPDNWMIDSTLRLIPGTSQRVSPDLCALHAKELRRVRLENNPVFGW